MDTKSSKCRQTFQAIAAQSCRHSKDQDLRQVRQCFETAVSCTDCALPQHATISAPHDLDHQISRSALSSKHQAEALHEAESINLFSDDDKGCSLHLSSQGQPAHEPLMQTRHGHVKGHTKGIDIFSKDFILIPAHKGLHWTLIVVCYPSPAYKGQHRGVLHLDSLPGCIAVSWDQFVHFMLDSFGLLQPVTETRSAYDVMVQSDYDTVSEFVREFRLKERELIGTPYHPGGSAIVDFIKKLTPAVRKYVQDNAPEEWWTYVKQVYKKSLRCGEPGLRAKDCNAEVVPSE
ncbi:TPA: hypothetical protein ACH3X1_001022 [Trebouxia sp. C0004]